MDFYAGQRVECVNVSGNEVLHLGAAYTVAKVHPFYFETSQQDGLELTDQSVHWIPFYATRFRPVDTRKTDISALTRLAKPVQQKQEV